MKKLYEISDEILEVLDGEYESEEEFDEAIEKIATDFITKADNIAKYRQELIRQSESIKSEIERLQGLKNAIDNKEKRLKNYLEEEMIKTGMEKFKTDLFGFNIQNNPPSLNITDDSNIPEEYITYQKKINKRGLLRDIKQSGLYVEGVELKKTRGLRIR